MESANSYNSQFKLIEHPRTIKFLSERGIKTNISKEELLQRGYVMENQVGLAERAIVREIDDNDTSEYALLTKSELEKHIKETLPEGIDKTELSEVEKDMKLFILDALFLSENSQPLTEEKVHILINFLINMKRSRLFESAFNNKFKAETFMDDFLEISRNAQKAVRDECNLNETLRGIPVNLIRPRKEGNDVNGHRCPMLNCSHNFDSNYGIIVYNSVKDIDAVNSANVRLNFVVAHLASHGISENGPHQKDYSSQNYADLRWYQPIYDKRNKSDVKAMNNNINIEEALFKKVLTLANDQSEANISKEIIEKVAKEYISGEWYEGKDYS